MRSNILRAIFKLSMQRNRALPRVEEGVNRMNDMGDSLENYIRDAFIDDAAEREQVFSYLGSSSRPPDLILREGDAIEVKKLQSNSDIQLNSSNPKQILRHCDQKLNRDAQECEPQPWDKDVVYVVGHVPKSSNQVDSLWFVYGDCYADKEEIYIDLFSSIQTSIEDTDGLDFSRTKELGRVNGIDSQGNTHLRIRSMRLLKHPTSAFNNLPEQPGIYAIMKNRKYESFPQEDRVQIEQNININIRHDFLIPDPEAEGEFISVTLISST
ncbi:NgoPII family restriction endonuclease [Vibrio chagasii]|uniref:NgoPII family restriction endonuclease n=1 Tax=Vibrio chagasii TaxID=170679 RepID=UPI003DA0741E